jgi:hypothetical protein
MPLTASQSPQLVSCLQLHRSSFHFLQSYQTPVNDFVVTRIIFPAVFWISNMTTEPFHNLPVLPLSKHWSCVF